MAYRNGYARRTRSTSRTGKWMDLRYAGTCRVCKTELPAGTRAYWEPSDRSTTCTAMDCAAANGLTEEVWNGSPVSGSYVTQLSATRFAPFGNRGRFGRCEDAPCCGCCD